MTGIEAPGGMFSDDDLLSISGLRQLGFCERRWVLIHLEQVWEENVLTVEGRQFHEVVHEEGADVRSGVRMARGLRLRSLALGLCGAADLVEFHPHDSGAKLPGFSGRWIPYPVEYKRGHKRSDSADEIWLCAQALCLEEMLVRAERGYTKAIFKIITRIKIKAREVLIAYVSPFLKRVMF